MSFSGCPTFRIFETWDSTTASILGFGLTTNKGLPSYFPVMNTM